MRTRVAKPAVVRSRGRRAHLVRTSFHRRYHFPASPLRGSLESLERQNALTQAEGLQRILDDQDLNNRIAEKLLVPLPEMGSLAINPGLSETYRYCRPWTADFLRDLANEHEAEFHRPVQVNSAVRTVEYQKRLMHVNGNAAAAEGDIVSPHLTGSTIDIGKHGMSRKELTWMRSWLLKLQVAGVIDVEEEFRQACFHITVYKSYDGDGDTQPLRDAHGLPAAAPTVAAGGE